MRVRGGVGGEEGDDGKSEGFHWAYRRQFAAIPYYTMASINIP